MRKLIYTSRATLNFDESRLSSLLEQSRARNATSDITGLLLFANDYFIQFLEGAYDAVEKVFGSIRNDYRHEVIDVCKDTLGDTRSFPDWNMGVGISAKSLMTVPGEFIDIDSLTGMKLVMNRDRELFGLMLSYFTKA